MITHASWVSDVTFENVSTIDRRFIVAGALSWRDLPLTLMAMHVNSGSGHTGSYVAGRIDTLSKDPIMDMNGGPLSHGEIALRGKGMFDLTGQDGANIARLVGDEMMRGISVDLAGEEIGLRNPETGEVKTMKEVEYEDVEAYFMGERELAFIRAKVVAATVVPTPAFDDARIGLVAGANGEKVLRTVGRFKLLQEPEVILASGNHSTYFTHTPWTWTDGMNDATGGNMTLTAAAAPPAPPRAWFETQELPGPTPLTIDDAGRVFGHVALWDSCHVGFGDMCMKPPRSPSDYAYFHVGELETAEGDKLTIGKLMYGGPHASVTKSRGEAMRHYDVHTHVAGFGRCTDGEYGIWFAGALRHDLTEEDIRQVRANPPSGDWRPVNGVHELVSVLTVPVPGFPTPRAQTAVLASGDEFEVLGLIVTSGEIVPNKMVTRALVAAGLAEAPSRLTDAEQVELLAAEADEDPVGALAALAEEA